MKIALDDIRASPKDLSYVEEAGDLNARLGSGVRDYRVAEGVAVDVTYHRAGLDVFFRGTLHGRVIGCCARCLGEYTFEVERPFSFVLTPRAAAGTAPARAQLGTDDIGLAHYEGEEIDLAPLVYEEAILALPTRPLCREGCRGLCARCGADLNTNPCDCPAEAPDPRLAVLRTLSRRK